MSSEGLESVEKTCSVRSLVPGLVLRPGSSTISLSIIVIRSCSADEVLFTPISLDPEWRGRRKKGIHEKERTRSSTTLQSGRVSTFGMLDATDSSRSQYIPEVDPIL
jgi:hypothetical protein